MRTSYFKTLYLNIIVKKKKFSKLFNLFIWGPEIMFQAKQLEIKNLKTLSL